MNTGDDGDAEDNRATSSQDGDPGGQKKKKKKEKKEKKKSEVRISTMVADSSDDEEDADSGGDEEEAARNSDMDPEGGDGIDVSDEDADEAELLLGPTRPYQRRRTIENAADAAQRAAEAEDCAIMEATLADIETSMIQRQGHQRPPRRHETAVVPRRAGSDRRRMA